MFLLVVATIWHSPIIMIERDTTEQQAYISLSSMLITVNKNLNSKYSTNKDIK